MNQTQNQEFAALMKQKWQVAYWRWNLILSKRIRSSEREITGGRSELFSNQRKNGALVCREKRQEERRESET